MRTGKHETAPRFVSLVLSSAVILASAAECTARRIPADELNYEGTVQMDTVCFSMNIGLDASPLVVESVLAEEGSFLEEGDPVLKLTADSYENALGYCAAAAIRAANELADTQLSYDQGVLESQYKCEAAQVKAEQAELVREFQENELDGAISDHEEVLEDLEEKITEVTEGIDNGSYDSSGDSGSSGSSGSGSGSSDRGGTSSDAEAPEEETMSGRENGEQSESADSGAELPADTAVSDEESAPSGEGSGPEESESSGENSRPEKRESSVENDRPEESEQPAESDTSDAATPPGEGDRSDEEAQSDDNFLPDETSAYDEEIQALKSQLAAKQAEYEALVSQISSLDLSSAPDASPADGAAGALSGALQDSLDGDGRVKTNMENVQANLAQVPESLIEAVTLVYPDYNAYVELLASCINQLDSDIQTQNAVCGYLGGLLQLGTEMNDLLQQLNDKNEGEAERLSENLTSVQEQLDRQTEELASVQSEYDKQTEELASVQSEYDKQTEELASVRSELDEQSEELASARQQLQKDGETQNEDAAGDESRDGNYAGGEKAEGTSAAGGVGNAAAEKAGESSSGGMSSASGAGTGASGAGGSASGASGGGEAAGGNAGETASADGASIDGGAALTDEEMSLLGDTYDLTQARNLLEQEPGDSDAAEELLTKLIDSQYDVGEQYKELLREEKVLRIEILHTWNTSVLAGKLAELTCRQEMLEWDETLREAKASKKEADHMLELLESMTDGVLRASAAGYVASVDVADGDQLGEGTSLFSYYVTDPVKITIVVPQEEIAQIAAGDTAEVTLNGMMKKTGTVISRESEPESDTAKGDVRYDVVISVENENGRLSEGASAEVAFHTGAAS